MSFWIERKEKNGRRYLWQIHVELLLPVTVIGVLAAIVLPELMRRPLRFGVVAGAVLALGLGLFVAAKTSLYWRGIWFSLGSAMMSRPCKCLYRVGYFFMVVGSLFLLAVSMAFRGRYWCRVGPRRMPRTVWCGGTCYPGPGVCC